MQRLPRCGRFSDALKASHIDGVRYALGNEDFMRDLGFDVSRFAEAVDALRVNSGGGGADGAQPSFARR